ncbi:MAG: HAD family phosphatase [Pseudomonadota bacterium]|nr:HAD family phosphatase [Pseudomonadota bacterium]
MNFAPPLLLDLDGSLVDSVYYHVLAWQAAFHEDGIDLPLWRIHRKIGMGSALFVQSVLRENGLTLSRERESRLIDLHGAHFQPYKERVQPLPGAKALLAALTAMQHPFAIATSSRIQEAERSLKLLELPSEVPIISGDDVAQAKPAPELFMTAAERLGHAPGTTVVVGDSPWDMTAARLAGAQAAGLLTGGFADSELTHSGAIAVFADPGEMRQRLNELGIYERDGM